jgi:hypothetical protein
MFVLLVVVLAAAVAIINAATCSYPDPAVGFKNEMYTGKVRKRKRRPEIVTGVFWPKFWLVL